VTKIHKARIRKLADFLATVVHKADVRVRKATENSGEPREKFDMGYWAEGIGKDKKLGVTKAKCGTSACAMGWATVVFPRTIHLNEDDGDFIPQMIRKPKIACEEIGIEFFGMTEEQADDAFLSGLSRSAKDEAAVLRQIAKDGN